MIDSTWKEYFEKTKGSKPRPLLVEALGYVVNKDNALDLGSSALNETRYLVDIGFKHVVAVDIEPVAEEIIENFPKNIVDYVISDFENFDFPVEKYDLVNAQYSLPFNRKTTFPRVFESIIKSVKPKGIFAGHLYGDKDGWNVGSGNMNFHTREEIEKLFSNLEIIKLIENESDENTVAGNMKHWHIFDFIIRKP